MQAKMCYCLLLLTVIIGYFFTKSWSSGQYLKADKTCLWGHLCELNVNSWGRIKNSLSGMDYIRSR